MASNKEKREFKPKNVIFAMFFGFLIGVAVSWYIFTSTVPNKSKNHDTHSDEYKNSLRLPRGYNPDSYDLIIKTYLPGYTAFPEKKNLTFEATVSIVINVDEATRSFILHAKYLTIKNVTVTMEEKNYEVKSTELHKDEDKLEITIKDQIPKGKAIVKIEYNGLINSNLGGFYQSKYIDKKGDQKISAITQFAPTDARQMVPCFDAPEYKSTWTITVIHPKGTTAISNGIEIRTKSLDDGFISSEFKRTPKMSAYLVAIVVSQFEFIEKSTGSGVRFRVWSRPEAKNQTLHALESGVKCLEFYEKYFDIKFPLEKQDMVAVPDFAFGAMENWGLITYKESRLLYDPKTSTALDKRNVDVTIAHELAHQWFGNLVTNEWWDDVWLNEGFASYVEYIGAEYISQGAYEMSNVFLDSSLERALNADNKASSHPLSMQIQTKSQISEVYDVIAYQKGASILNMIKKVMGKQLFNKGVNHYLKKFSYQSARSIDLWRALDEISGQSTIGPNGNNLNITHFALQWTTQLGYPYITLQNLNLTHVKISQERYKLNPNSKEDEVYANPKFGFKWDVPLWIKIGEDKPQLYWLSRDSSLLISSNDSPIVLNAGSPAFIRQNYDEKGWKRIFQQMKNDHTIYDIPTRHAIVSDAFAMVKIGELSYDLLFDLLDYRKKETNYFVSKVLRHEISSLQNYFGNDAEGKVVKKYLKQSTTPLNASEMITQISENYLSDENIYENLEAQSTFFQQCSLGSTSCKKELEILYSSEVEESCGKSDKASECVKIAAPLRKLVYCNAVKTGDQNTFDQMMNFYEKENVQTETDNILSSLACTQEPRNLKSLLSMALDRKSGKIRFQDVRSTFYAVSQNSIGKEMIFNYFLTNWNEIYKNFKSDHYAVTHIIRACTHTIRTRDQIKQLRNFQETAAHAKEFHEISKMIESSESRVAWIENNLQKLAQLFRQRVHN